MNDIKENVAFAVDYAVELVRQHLSAYLHEYRWHQTYNAALAGLSVGASNNEDSFDMVYVHEAACRAAIRLHGQLKRGDL